MEETENMKHFTGRELPDNALKASMADGTPYVLPPWRVNDIILLAIETLSDVDYYRDDFDYKKMIREQGIKIKKFSAFSPDNLEKFRKISLSRWEEGICALFPHPVTGEQCRMIAYNDNKSAAEVMQIIFHELAHIILRHTQQSNLGEMEATLFSGVAMLLMVLEQQFHIGRMIAEKGDKAMLKGIQEGLMRKFNAQEVL